MSKNVRQPYPLDQGTPGGSFDNRKRRIKYLTDVDWSTVPDEVCSKVEQVLGQYYRGKGGKDGPKPAAGAATPFSERSGRISASRKAELLSATPLGKQILAERRGKK